MPPFKKKIYQIIFEAETPAGRAFDVILLWAIVLSIVAVSLESIASVRKDYGTILFYIEWFFTIIFTLEYAARLWCVAKPVSYSLSFFGIIDLMAILPAYFSLFLTGAQSLVVVRALRLLRVFRILKLGHYVAEAHILFTALRQSRKKILVFLIGVLTTVCITATLMYLIEGEKNGFTSIPRSIYWAIVTMTTVGYGDIAPKTVLGQTLASAVMIIGYAIIAIPTGIVSVEMARVERDSITTRTCPHCTVMGHDRDAEFCKKCGGSLQI